MPEERPKRIIKYVVAGCCDKKLKNGHSQECPEMVRDNCRQVDADKGAINTEGFVK